ncbi:hypothetical protein G7085_04550 [Tessaracoccus sp. HDW20]|nr:hypothetical protein [Tessaracoccus coleopterorum]
MSTHAATEDIFAGSGDEKVDRVYLAQGGDWEDIAAEQAERGDETIVVNMGPSTRPRTACSASSSRWTVRPSPPSAPASASCTPASRRTWSSRRGPRA